MYNCAQLDENGYVKFVGQLTQPVENSIETTGYFLDLLESEYINGEFIKDGMRFNQQTGKYEEIVE